MAVKTTKKEHSDNSTQRYLPFSWVKENIILMKDWSARIVLRTSTINFLLKNTDEQDSIIISFQRFLNSLDFPIQIIIRSNKLDIDSYLLKLWDKALKQTNPLLQNQTYEYIEYLKKLIEVAQIMKKEFYLVIPFDDNENKSVKDDTFLWNFWNFWKSINPATSLLEVKSQLKNFSKLKKWLITRVNSIKTWLENIWIRWDVLEKWELIKLLIEYHNPNLDNSLNFKDIDKHNLINN